MWGTEGSSDSKILNFGRQEGMVVVTLDADFHTLLALSGMTGPSVVRIRIESLRGEALAKLLFSVLQICSDDLLKGAMVSVTENGVRIHRLPVTTVVASARPFSTR
jgi:predicted nuclease of predicted toxin-antitoxin system